MSCVCVCVCICICVCSVFKEELEVADEDESCEPLLMVEGGTLLLWLRTDDDKADPLTGAPFDLPVVPAPAALGALATARRIVSNVSLVGKCLTESRNWSWALDNNSLLS